MAAKTYYPFLDTFRGIAIVWVLLHHVSIFFDMKLLMGKWYALLAPFAAVGYLGVDMFFVISGFLITGLLLDDLDSRVRLKRFYVRRFFKIVPQYLLAVAVGLWLSYGFAPYFVRGLRSVDPLALPASYFLLFQNYCAPVPTLAHLWSLAIEEHFYLLYPLFLAFVCDTIVDPQRRRRVVKISLACVIIGVNLSRWLQPGNDFLSQWFGAPWPHQTTLYRIDALMFGCLLKFWEPHFQTNNPRRDSIEALGFFTLGMVLYYCLITTGAKHEAAATYTLSYLAPGLVVIAALKGLGRYMENRFLIWIGKSSYGIYLWHYILIFALARLMPAYQGWTGMGIYVGTALAVGVFSTRTIERAFLNVRKKVMP